MRKYFTILLFAISSLARCQDSVLHFNYWMKTKLDSIHAVDSFPIIGIYDFKALQLRDSSWFLDKQNLRNPFFQTVIQGIESTPYLMDSIKFEPINDTMYIQYKLPF